MFHISKDWYKRAFKTFIDRGDTFGGQTGFQQLPQAQRDIRIFGCIIQRRFGRQGSERHLLGTLAAYILIFDGRVIQPVPSQIIH